VLDRVERGFLPPAAGRVRGAAVVVPIGRRAHQIRRDVRSPVQTHGVLLLGDP